jgi:hypothetical protein
MAFKCSALPMGLERYSRLYTELKENCCTTKPETLACGERYGSMIALGFDGSFCPMFLEY